MATHTPDPLATTWTRPEVAIALRTTSRRVGELVDEDPSFPQPRRLGPRTWLWDPEAVLGWVRAAHEADRPTRRPAKSARRVVERV